MVTDAGVFNFVVGNVQENATTLEVECKFSKNLHFLIVCLQQNLIHENHHLDVRTLLYFFFHSIVIYRHLS